MRFILLGASNVTLAFPRLWRGLRRAASEPIEVFAAHGHGRSFGNWSRVGPRALPGIVSCGLWDDLAAQSAGAQPPRAIVTDIGNDLLYGIEPDLIAEWIATCLARLTAMSARIVMTQLPLVSAMRLGRTRFQFFRSLLFPSSDLSFEDLRPLAERLNQHLLDLGRQYRVETLEPRGHWYGFDPIHIRRRHRHQAWQELLASWFDAPTLTNFQAASPTESLRLWNQRPSARRWFRTQQTTTQPSLQDSDGSTLWLY